MCEWRERWISQLWRRFYLQQSNNAFTTTPSFTERDYLGIAAENIKNIKWWLFFYHAIWYNIVFHFSLLFSITVQRTFVKLLYSGELCLCDCWKDFEVFFFFSEKAPFWGTREASREWEGEKENGEGGREMDGSVMEKERDLEHPLEAEASTDSLALPTANSLLKLLFHLWLSFHFSIYSVFISLEHIIWNV